MSQWLYQVIAALGHYVISQVRGIGKLALFSWQVFLRLGAGFSRFGLVVQQIHFIGNYSLVIISVSGLFVGFVLGLQGYYILVRYGSEQALGVLVAVSLLRELGPVVTALLFAGRAGTSLTAEIGLMRAGEQLAAMEMMGVDPLRRIIVPRIGSWFVGVQLIGTDNGAFWSQMQNGVDLYIDVVNSVIKSFVFGVIVGLVALFQGYSSRPTPDGVSRATTRTVVISSLLVLGVDFMMTALMFSGI